jgi:hypothetical protein
MANLMPLVHQARRTIRNRQDGNPFATDAVIAELIEALGTAYLAAPNERVSRAIKVELLCSPSRPRHRRPRPRLRRAGAERGHDGRDHRRNQRGRGVRGQSPGWRPDLPNAHRERFIPLLWLKVHELLGRVPAGSTARFIQDGSLPGDTRPSANVYRLAS